MPAILVVDDEEDIRDLLKEYLTSRGYHVVTAATGNEALSHVAREEFQAALVDWCLPGINGQEVVARIHEEQPDCVLIAITGHADAVVTRSSVGDQLTAVLRKPFSLQTLADVLARWTTP